MKKLIRVTTYNVEHCLDRSIVGESITDAPIHIEAIAALLKKTKADIYGLNEIKDLGWDEVEKQTAKIAALTQKRYHVFAEGVRFPGGDDLGNSILSDYKILNIEKYKVYAPIGTERRPDENMWYEDRVILVCTIDVGRPIKVISTHFGLNGLEKERMIETLCKVIDNCTEPIILMGDFNSCPHSEILEPIYKRLVSAADVMKNDEYTWESYNPQMTLDYIFVSKDIEINSYEVRKEIVSDHRACVAELYVNI